MGTGVSIAVLVWPRSAATTCKQGKATEYKNGTPSSSPSGLFDLMPKSPA